MDDSIETLPPGVREIDATDAPDFFGLMVAIGELALGGVIGELVHYARNCSPHCW